MHYLTFERPESQNHSVGRAMIPPTMLRKDLPLFYLLVVLWLVEARPKFLQSFLCASLSSHDILYKDTSHTGLGVYLTPV